MKASELYAILSKMTPAEREATRVVMSCDAEGNGFAPMHSVTREKTGANLDISHATNTALREIAENPVIVLWPMWPM